MTKLLDGRLRWVLIFLCFLIACLAYMENVNISIAASAIKSEFSLSNVQMGWVFSAFVLGYALFQAPGGRFADRHGPRLAITVCLLWWSVFTVFTIAVPAGLAISLALLIAARFGLGVGEALMFPTTNRLVAVWIPSNERGVANGVIFAGVGAGAALAPPLLTFVLLTWGWRWSFLVRVPVQVLAALAWYWLVRNTPQEHPWMGKKELETIQAGLPARPKGAGAEKALPWHTILGNRSMAAVTFSYFVFGYVAWISSPGSSHT